MLKKKCLDIFTNAVICFLAESEMRRVTPLSSVPTAS